MGEKGDFEFYPHCASPHFRTRRGEHRYTGIGTLTYADKAWSDGHGEQVKPTIHL